MITKCKGGGCELIATCRRYIVAPVPGQKWYSVPPVEADGQTCPQYLPQDMGAPLQIRIPVTPNQEKAPWSDPAPAKPASPTTSSRRSRSVSPPVANTGGRLRRKGAAVVTSDPNIGTASLTDTESVVPAAAPVPDSASSNGSSAADPPGDPRKDRAKKAPATPKKQLPKPATVATVAVSTPTHHESEDDMAILSPTQLKPLKGQKQHPMHKAKSKDGPTHVTGAGTCKYQANGPVNWAQEFRKIAREIGGPGAPVGIGIRAVLMAGLSLPQEKIVKLAHGAVKAVDMLPSKEE